MVGKRDRLFDVMLRGVITDSDFAEQRARIDRELSDHDAELAALDALPELRDVLPLVEELLTDPYALWQRADLAGKATLADVWFRTGITVSGRICSKPEVSPFFGLISTVSGEKRGMVDLSSASWNLVGVWLRQIEAL